MKSFLIVFSVIALANAKPADYNEPYNEGSASGSAESVESVEIAESAEKSNLPVTIYTKYPDDPNDEYSPPDPDDLPVELRTRRLADGNETYSLAHSNETTNQPITVPLRGIITAIESNLVTKAIQVNSQLRKRRSTTQFSDEDNSYENVTNTNDSADVNKDLFDGLFNFTRPERDSEVKDVKIPLNGLVKAVESTLVNSAQNIKDPKLSKREVDTDKQSADNSKTEPGVQVQKLNSENTQNLNILNPITFKSVSVTPVTEATTPCDDECISTTEIPLVQKTNLTVFEASNSTSLIPGPDKKLAHIQHQEITKTVFHSSLAIFPTIPPKSINAPLTQHITTTDESIETTVTVQTSTIKSEQDAKHDELLQKVEKLKEKFAEIQADPVILSQF